MFCTQSTDRIRPLVTYSRKIIMRCLQIVGRAVTRSVDGDSEITVRIYNLKKKLRLRSRFSGRPLEQ